MAAKKYETIKVEKGEGITWVICEMSTPGIDVRPIESIEGGSEFCEVFYDDVRIPLGNVVGDVGEGWSVAMATLSFERGTAFTANQVRLAKIIEDLIDYARDHVGPDGRRPAIADDEIARRLARARARLLKLLEEQGKPTFDRPYLRRVQ